VAARELEGTVKKIKSPILIALALIFTLFGTGAGCSSTKTTTNNTLIVWGFDDADTFKPIIRDFEKQFPGVKVNYVQKTLNSDYELNSLGALAAGQGPDVWTVPNTWLLREADKIVPYTPPKTTDEFSKIDPKSYFVPAVVNNVTLNGKIYGLTPSIDTLRLYYNPTLLDKARTDFDTANKANPDYRKKIDSIIDQGPLFWDDIVALDQALTIKNGPTVSRATVAMGTSNNISVGNDILYLIMLQNKTKFLSDDNQTAIFNLPSQTATGESVTPAAKALDFYTGLAIPANPSYNWNTSMANDSDTFTAGNTIMTFNYESYAETLGQKYPTFKSKQWAMPQILSSSNQEITDLARFNLMVVPALSKQQASAWNFVKYTSTTGQSTYISATKRAGSALGNGKDIKITDRQGANPDSVEKYTAQAMPQMSRFPVQFDGYFSDAVSAVNDGKLTAQQALDGIADKVTQLLRNKGY
jgi:ABC-type glycerol-3-phosphate transport system substrate-binding protein